MNAFEFVNPRSDLLMTTEMPSQFLVNKFSKSKYKILKMYLKLNVIAVIEKN